MALKSFITGIFLLCGVLQSTGQETRIRAEVGEDATLPVMIDGPLNITDLKVTWTKKTNNGRVHEFSHGKDYLRKQDPHFRGRTSLFKSEMKNGNLSLKLKNVTQEDKGYYSCKIIGENHPLLNTIEVYLDVERENENDQSVGSGRAKEIGETPPEENDRTRMYILLLVPVLLVMFGIIYKYKSCGTTKSDSAISKTWWSQPRTSEQERQQNNLNWEEKRTEMEEPGDQNANEREHLY